MFDISNTVSRKAIKAVENGIVSFCKFLSANDTSLTGGHQCGIYIPKPSVPLIFDKQFEKGDNVTRNVIIKWQDDFSTESAFKYYGRGTRNEYRITKFGKGFDLLRPDKTGSLLVLVKQSQDDYAGFVLEYEDEINEFLDYFAMTPADTGKLIDIHNIGVMSEADEKRKKQQMLIMEFIYSLNRTFPSANEMSAKAREIQGIVYNHNEYIVCDPDSKLIAWLDTEYSIFKNLEEAHYGELIRKGFSDMQTFLELANSVLNRRKSRAGKSLEFHLEALFNGNNLQYESQAITEVKKKPDFLFPSAEAYHDRSFPTEKLVVLGAKTTCKDRWRQVITEADRIDTKYLCTLQQGISANQLEEMKAENVVLVVPEEYICTYPKEYRGEILTIKNFIDYVTALQKDS